MPRDNNGAESLGSPPPETSVVAVDRGAEGGNEFTSGRCQGAAVPCRPDCGPLESLRLAPPEARARDVGEERGESIATSLGTFWYRCVPRFPLIPGYRWFRSSSSRPRGYLRSVC